MGAVRVGSPELEKSLGRSRTKDGLIETLAKRWKQSLDCRGAFGEPLERPLRVLLQIPAQVLALAGREGIQEPGVQQVQPQRWAAHADEGSR